MNQPGLLIAIEGIDGAGKTTQVRLLKDSLERVGAAPVVSKEPTDGPWGRRIKASAVEGRMSLEEELEAFVRDRTEHVAGLIGPALAEGRIVILDRYFPSTVAYQGARGADPDEIRRRMESLFPIPDLILILDLEPEAGLHRVAHLRGDQPNSFENLETLSRARALFNQLGGTGVHRIDATQPIAALHARILEALSGLLSERGASGRELALKLRAAIPAPA